ncbi:MAG: RNA-binding S4 domain-containing protein [Candidatus Omnitrophica bacterium]|nr:RNA-binding S4 domain-containing protein [Candidatus Omnitrophota bacterium]
MEFQLKADFIELDNLLKNMKLVANGAEAREHIQAARVKVNGEVESRIRRKLRLGDTVEFKAEQIKIVKTN